MKRKQYTHIDCFSGPGGICTGLHAADYDTKVAIEYVGTCCDTYRLNHPEVHVIHNDIRIVSADDVLPHIPKKGIDLVTSGMPCETFSTAGNTSRSFYDDRQVLYRQGLRIALISNAKFILFENVPAIQTKTVARESKDLIVDQLFKELDESGYSNNISVVLNAQDYGVPQMRKRFFILATNDPNIKLKVPAPTKVTPFTVEEALCDLPDVVPSSGIDGTEYLEPSNDYTDLMKNDDFWKRSELKRSGLTEHHPMNHRPSTIDRFSRIAQGEGLEQLYKRYSEEERKELIEKRILPRKWFACRNRRLKADEPSFTLTSHCLEEFIHPTSNRALTVRECARLQSFPDSYRFCGPFSVGHDNRVVQDKYEQIGDAVPPLLAYHWGLTIKSLLDEYYSLHK